MRKKTNILANEHRYSETIIPSCRSCKQPIYKVESLTKFPFTVIETVNVTSENLVHSVVKKKSGIYNLNLNESRKNWVT